MTTLETAVTTTEHRCEALTISDIPPYRCTTSATADRRGRAVCGASVGLTIPSKPPDISWPMPTG
jgi:hypothetical protein